MSGQGVGKHFEDLGIESTLRDSDLQFIKSRYPLPEGYIYRLPDASEESIRKLNSGTVIFRASLGLGLRFPFSDFGVAFLKEQEIAPGELHPHSWMKLIGFEVHCRLRGVTPSLPLFYTFFWIRGNSGIVPYSIQRVCQPGFSNNLFKDLPNKLHGFEKEWFILEFPESLGIRTRWIERTSIPRGPRVSSLKMQLSHFIEKLLVDTPVDLHDLLDNNNLLAAGWGIGGGQAFNPPAPSPTNLEPQADVGNTNRESSPEDASLPDLRGWEGFGSTFMVLPDDETININPLQEYLNSPEGNL